jgi:heme oxygenase
MNLPMSLEGHAPMAPAPDPLLLLRQGTRRAHEAVEALPAMRRLFAPDYTLDEYRRLLQALWPLLQTLEADLLAAGQHDRIRASVSRSEALRRDLLALGAVPPVALPHGIPIASESQRAGVLYVLEGSALGGQLIRRALLKRFGPAADGWCHYFDCHAGAAGRQWRAYGKALRNHPALDTAALVGAAEFTFQRFSERLAALPVPGPVPAAMHAGGSSACPFARARQWAARFGTLRDRLRAWLRA